MDLTVLMTVYNGEPYLREAVESILNQTFNEFKFMVVDDASTDGSRKIIRSFRDSRIQLETLPCNIGQTAALNYGLDRIDTPWVARMDSDDISLPRRFEYQMNYLKENPKIRLLGTAGEYVTANGSHVKYRYKPKHHKDILRDCLQRNMFLHSSVIFRHSTVSEIGGYPKDYKYIQDRPLWLAIMHRHLVGNLENVLVKIRMHPYQGLHRFRSSMIMWEEKIRILETALIQYPFSKTDRITGRASLVKAILNYATALSNKKQYHRMIKVLLGMLWDYPDLFIPGWERITGYDTAGFIMNKGFGFRWKRLAAILLNRRFRISDSAVLKARHTSS